MQIYLQFSEREYLRACSKVVQIERNTKYFGIIFLYFRIKHIILHAVRNKEIYKVTLVGGAVNVLLLVFKFVAGILGHSAAMVADAVHSLSDFVTDIIVLLFVHISGKPKDKSHDYGHGKYETLAMTLIGVALLAAAIGIVYSGVIKIIDWFNGQSLEAPGLLALWAALLSVIMKEAVYRYSMVKARQLNSQAVEANAWHHRSDALSSLGTSAPSSWVSGGRCSTLWLLSLLARLSRKWLSTCCVTALAT